MAADVAGRPAVPPRALAIDRRRILLAGLDLDSIERIEPAFSRVDFDLDRAPSLRHALKVAELARFDLIVVGFLPGEPQIETLLSILRPPGSPNVTSRVALLAAPEDLALARLRAETLGAKALSRSLGQLELQEALLNLLRSRARLAIRVMTRLSVRLADRATTQLVCQTYDLSRNGLFVVTQSRFPLGATVRFNLDLPDGGQGIHGIAEVVRHAVDRRDHADGVGLRFVEFASDGERRLASFLERHLR